MKHSVSLARNVFSNWTIFAASLLYGLFITPLVIDELGKELYGVWAFLNGLLSYTELLYLGLGASLVKSISKFRAHGDVLQVARLVSVVSTIYGTLGLTAFGLFAMASPWIPSLLAGPLSENSVHLASVTFIILGAQVMFVFFGSVFAGVVAGHERYDLLSAVSAAGIAIRVVLILALVPGNPNPMLILAAITAGATAVQSTLLAAVAFWLVPSLSVRLVRPKLPELSHLYGFGLQAFLIVMASKLINYTDTTVIGVTLGASNVALYAVPLALLQYSRNCVGGFTGVFVPRLTILVTQGDLAAVRSSYLSTVRIAFFISGWLTAGIIAVGPMFISLWIGPDFGEPVQWVIIWLAIAGMTQVLSSQAPFPFYQAMGLLRLPAATLMVEAVANLALSLWLAPRLGITGVALATALPALLISLIVLPRYLCRQLGVRAGPFLTQGILPGFLMTIGSLLALEGTGRLLACDSYATIFTMVLSTLPCALAVFRFSFPRDEQLRVWRTLGLLRFAPAR